MKVIAAFDSFKGSMDAFQASRAAALGFAAARPGLAAIEKPLADGGEGTAKILLDALDGEWVPARVSGPIEGRAVDAGFAWFPQSREAVVEMASASGLERLDPGRYAPLQATTRGTGELIAAAIDLGARKIRLAVGGSATIDGGTGALSALGWRFVDRTGSLVGPGGGELGKIAAVLPPGKRSAVGLPERFPPIELLCDVSNPLCGDRGAARFFGPQKEADPQAVVKLEEGLRHLARLAPAASGSSILDLPCGGAGGGIVAGFHAFLGAGVVMGIDAVLDATGFDSTLHDADCVVTGEGCFDSQSLCGKVIAGVAARLRGKGKRLFVLAGRVDLPPEAWRALGIEAALSLEGDDDPPVPALPRGTEQLRHAAARLADEYFDS